jgi:hypothetical protein
MACQLESSARDMPDLRRVTAIRTLVLCAMCLGVLIAQIDTSVVNLATTPSVRPSMPAWLRCSGCWTPTT